MKSNNTHTESIDFLFKLLSVEKEKLVSSFLSHASIQDLAEHYQRIAELEDQIKAQQEKQGGRK